jgi:hypothetical protein
MDVFRLEGPVEPFDQLPLGGEARRWRLLARTWPGDPRLQSRWSATIGGAQGRQVGDAAGKGSGPAAHRRLRTVSDRQTCQAGRDRGSPNRESTLLSKRVIAQI